MLYHMLRFYLDIPPIQRILLTIPLYTKVMNCEKPGLVDRLEGSLWPKIDYMQQELSHLETLISALLNRFVLPSVERLLARVPDAEHSSSIYDSYRIGYPNNIAGCVRNHHHARGISTGAPLLHLYDNTSMSTIRAQDQPSLDHDALHLSLLLRPREADSPSCGNYCPNPFFQPTEQRLVAKLKQAEEKYKEETTKLAAKIETLKRSFQQLSAQFCIHELEHGSLRSRKESGGTGRIRRSSSIYTLKTLKTVHSLCDLGKSTRQVYAESLKISQHTNSDIQPAIQKLSSKTNLLKVHFASPSRRDQRIANRDHHEVHPQEAIMQEDSSSNTQDLQQEQNDDDDDSFDELTSLFESSIFFKDSKVEQEQQHTAAYSSGDHRSMYELESIVSRLSLADD